MGQRHIHWSGKERGGRFGNLFFLFLVRRRLLWVAYFFLFWVALYFLVAAPTARRSSFELARRLNPKMTWFSRARFSFSHFFTFGSLLLDRAAILGGGADLYTFEFPGEANLLCAREDDRGLVLVTAHLGGWEALGHLVSRFDIPMTVVMHDGVQPALRTTMDDIDHGRSYRVLFSDSTPATAARVLEALSKGELVGMMGDRVLAGRGVEAPFLGGTATFATGPFALAAAAGVPLLFAFAVRKGLSQYEFHVSDPVNVQFTTAAEKRAALEESSRHFARHLEGMVRQYPAQWRNLFAFWHSEEEQET